MGVLGIEYRIHEENIVRFFRFEHNNKNNRNSNKSFM